ncbi:hypothetical protein [Halobacteriovorax sp. HLS]|uniref:hypothetical protein n=1 Tax=Halobacteriovorax sp. HLS TaxID=2234000 RepID=UPI000FDA9DF3|nr:hypothetical protein [Halobacteriovorax sp. HLS]
MRCLLLLILFTYSSLSFAIDADNVDIPEVYQREYIHTDYKKHKFVQTYGVFTCVAVIIYSDSKRAVLAHFDASTKIDRSIDQLLSNFSAQESLTITLAGGQTPFKLEEQLRANLREKGYKVSKTIRNKKNDALSIMLNLDNGEVFEYSERVSSTDWKVSRAKIDRLKFEKRLYRHELSIGGGDYIEILEQPNEGQFNFLNF